MSNILENIYVIVIFIVPIISVTRKVNRSEIYYQWAAGIFGVFMIMTIVSGIFHFFFKSEENSMIILIFLIGAVLSYVLPVIMHCSELSLCKFALGKLLPAEISFNSVLLGAIILTYLTPTLINVFVIYAISNLHDISWGNRPSNSGMTKEEQNRQEDYEIFRSKFLIGWLFTNVGFSYVVIYLSRNNQNGYIMLFAIFVGGILWFRLVLAFLNRLLTIFDKCRL